MTPGLGNWAAWGLPWVASGRQALTLLYQVLLFLLGTVLGARRRHEPSFGGIHSLEGVGCVQIVAVIQCVLGGRPFV